ncbi:MAG TPA: hypothetical protein PKN90_05630, partial [Paludibacteraceae bacterium]|nr:hypothetical protein [Paludibacteraceae bacterium]
MIEQVYKNLSSKLETVQQTLQRPLTLTEKIYILDTNILINFSIWCPMEFNEGFWLKLEKLLEEGKWILLDVVV